MLVRRSAHGRIQFVQPVASGQSYILEVYLNSLDDVGILLENKVNYGSYRPVCEEHRKKMFQLATHMAEFTL